MTCQFLAFINAEGKLSGYTKQTPKNLLDPYEPRHDKTNKMAVRPAKIQISLGIRPV